MGVVYVAVQVEISFLRPCVSPNHPSAVQESPFTVTPIRSTREEPLSILTSKVGSEAAKCTIPNQEASQLSKLEKTSISSEVKSVETAKMECKQTGIPIVEEICAPSNQFRTSSAATTTTTTTTDNPVASVSVAVASDSNENAETLFEPVAPTQNAEEDIHSICVVGEIVTTVKF